MAITTAAIMISMIVGHADRGDDRSRCENTRSTTTSCARSPTTGALALRRGHFARPSASTSPWISCVALAIRNRPPPIRMMSRQENDSCRTIVTTRIGQLRSARSAREQHATRKTNASDRPIWRARGALGRRRAARHQHRDEHDVVDAEHDLERGQRRRAPPRHWDRSAMQTWSWLPRRNRPTIKK